MANVPTSNFARTEYEVYQSGKSRRYTLLFSVNGGAFALLKFAIEQGDDLFTALPYGMMVFTSIMFLDIWAFGDAISKKITEAFACIGRLVLIVICLLILTGWGLVALGDFKYFRIDQLHVLLKTGISLIIAAAWLLIARLLYFTLKPRESATETKASTDSPISKREDCTRADDPAARSTA